MMNRLIEEPPGGRREARAGRGAIAIASASALAAVLMTGGMLIAVAPPDEVSSARQALIAQQLSPAIDEIA